MADNLSPAWASDPKVYAEVVAFAEYLGFDTQVTEEMCTEVVH